MAINAAVTLAALLDSTVGADATLTARHNDTDETHPDGLHRQYLPFADGADGGDPFSSAGGHVKAGEVRLRWNAGGPPERSGIKAAKTALPCWNVDTQAIWERFLAFNRARGNARVPAGYLLGFMRRWRTNSSCMTPTSASEPEPLAKEDSTMQELHDQIRAAPSSNRQFHASDLCRLIGQAAYDARVLDVVRKFGCPKFAAILAVHGRAVLVGEISR